jgi:hypothetical protein
MLRIVVQLTILRRGMARGGSWVVLSPWLEFWWVLIAAGCACLHRRRVAGNGAGGGIISSQGPGRETISGRARGKHDLSSAGAFPLHGKPPVDIADVPSLLARANDMHRAGGRTAQAYHTATHILSVGRRKQTRTDGLGRWFASVRWRCP